MSIWNLENLPSANDDTAGVKKIIAEETQALKKFSVGHVYAKFGKIKSISVAMAGFANIAERVVSGEIEDTDTRNLADANSLYQVTRYGFEIYNKTYRFRLFELDMSPNYPIRMKIDSDILKEEYNNLLVYCSFDEKTSELVIDNENAFFDCFRIVINNHKVLYIIAKMMNT